MELIEKQANGQSGGDGNAYLRTCRLEIRVSPMELEAIEKYCRAAGFHHVAPYLRAVGTHGINAENPKAVRRALVSAQAQLSRIGTNLNQIARKVNAGQPLDGEILVALLQIADLAETILHDASYGVSS